MAYMDQSKKAELAPAIKNVLKKYKMKASLAVRNYSTLVCNIKSGPIDIIGNMVDLAIKRPDSFSSRTLSAPTYIQVNEFWIQNHYTGEALKFLTELKDAMNVGNYDRSDMQSDYFDVGFYIDINVGNWDKPYILTA